MNLKRKIANIAAASILALGMGTAAYAETTTTGQVTQEITAGTLTFSIEDAELGPVQYSEEIVDNDGILQLSVNGNGNLDGWHLSVQATGDFKYEGASADGNAIPANYLALTEAEQPEHLGGQPIDETHGPVAITNGPGSLGDPIAVISSPSGYGSGSYSQELNVSLRIPAGSQVGTYTGEVTVSSAAGPGMGED